MSRSPETLQAVAELAARNEVRTGQIKGEQIAKALGVSRRTVRDMLEQVGPEVEAFKKPMRDEMLVAWHDTFFSAYQEMQAQPSANDRKNLAITMGISTEKVQLLSGQPTALVANLHEVRISMPELIQKLGRVANVLEAEKVD